jgi:hypothetical protein
MKKTTHLFWTVNPSIILRASLFAVLLASSCTPKSTPDPNAQIRQAVAETLAAIPTATSAPQPTPYPLPTPFDLNGLFCEYQFCIGHPQGMAFYDHLATLNPQTPSEYKNGFLVSYQIPILVINLIWLQAPGTADPQFLLETILDDQVDIRNGNLDVKLIHGMNVMYTPITTTISPEVPFGAVAAWTCGDRVFAWKVYTPQAETTQALFDSTIARFTCGQ